MNAKIATLGLGLPETREKPPEGLIDLTTAKVPLTTIATRAPSGAFLMGEAPRRPVLSRAQVIEINTHICAQAGITCE